MKKFIMYGAGNIGRGFIGANMSKSGYKVGFIDINKEIIDRLNADKSYPINIVDGNSNTEELIENVYGIDGGDISTVVEEIASCDLMAVALGANVLKFTTNPLAKAIERRKEQGKPPLNIIICENLLHADKYLKELIKSSISPDLHSYLDENVGFIESSIGRMVPTITDEKKQGNPLRVYVERYDILPVDKDAFIGGIPNIYHLYPYSPFALFIERKLYIHNMSHAVTAYLGSLLNYRFIYESILNNDIRVIVQNAQTEGARALSKEHGADINMLIEHGNNLIYRFQNTALEDLVSRVGRDTIRKLNKSDRLIGCLNMCLKHNITPYYLLIGIAASLCFNDQTDANSQEVANYCKQFGAAAALKKYGEFENESLTNIIQQFYELLIKKDIKKALALCDTLSNKEIKV